MQLTQEQIQEAMQAAMQGQAGFEQEPEVGPIFGVIEAAAQSTTIKNVIKVQGGEVRCIVTNNHEIKPTTIVDGVTTQEYIVEDDDAIAWISMINGTREFVVQDKHGINPVTAEAFGPMFGSKTGYALSYLGSFNGDNNILLDDEKVDNFNRAEKYAADLMSDTHDDLRTLITSRCTSSPNYEESCQTWDEAEVYDIEDSENRKIVWGCRVRTEATYVEFQTQYVIIWATPMVRDTEGNVVEETIMQVMTRQVPPNSVPQLGPDSEAVFEVEETLNKQVKAYAVMTEDTITGVLKSITLFKTEGFDVNKASF